MTDRPHTTSLADLVATERDAAPDPAAEARVWAGVEHRLLHGPPPPALPEPGVGLLLKWIGGLALAGGLVGGGALLLAELPGPPTAVPAPTILAPIASVPQDMSLPPLPMSQVAPAAPSSRAPELAAPELAAPGRPRRPPTVEAAPAGPLDLEAELRLVASIRAAIKRGDIDGALARIAEHRRDFGSAGALVQERSAHEVEAVCAAGRVTDARRLAENFLKQWPESPHRARVAASCADR